VHRGTDADPATTVGNHSERSAAALGVGNRWLRYRLCRAEVFAKRGLGTTGRGGVGPYIFSGASGVLFGREAVGRHCHLLLGVPGTPAPAATRPLVDFEFCGGGACFEVVGGLPGVGHRIERPSGPRDNGVVVTVQPPRRLPGVVSADGQPHRHSDLPGDQRRVRV